MNFLRRKSHFKIFTFFFTPVFHFFFTLAFHSSFSFQSMEPHGPLWSPMEPIEPYGALCEANGALWSRLEPYGSWWGLFNPPWNNPPPCPYGSSRRRKQIAQRSPIKPNVSCPPTPHWACRTEPHEDCPAKPYASQRNLTKPTGPHSIFCRLETFIPKFPSSCGSFHETVITKLRQTSPSKIYGMMSHELLTSRNLDIGLPLI